MSSNPKEIQGRFSQMFNHIVNVDYSSSINILMTFKYKEVKGLLSGCQILFDKYNNVEIDGREYEPNFNKLPDEGNEIELLTRPSLFSEACIFLSRDAKAAQEKYVRQMVDNDKVLDFPGWFFLIDQTLSSSVPTEFKDAKMSYAVYQNFKNIADYKFSGILAFLCGTSVLEVPSIFLSEYITEMKKAESFLTIDFNESKPESKIFKSVLYDNLSKEDKKNRLLKFFSLFDTIIQEFIVSCNNYYEKYSLHQLKKELDITCIMLNEKIKKSVENVKGELLLIISMAFAISQFDFQWVDNTIKNIVLIACIILVSVIYTFLITYDRISLTDLSEIIDAEEKRLKKIGVDDKQKSENFRIISKDVERIRKSITSHKYFMTFCLIAIWIPSLILVIGIIIQLCKIGSKV